MNVVVFLGPSLSMAEARALLDATYLPPASQGDVLRATLSQPTAIALIDGYFERTPAVWHKELLWAMSCGIHVYGASSMGALRATELAQFGMEGVGEVFEAFRDGILDDDDEVAVMHGPAEAGYVCGSEAMVNIRATLRRALADSVIGHRSHDTLVSVAKATFYPDRTFESLLAAAPAAGVPEADCKRLREWLGTGRVDVKRDDAAALLRRIAADHRAPIPPKKVSFRFQHTITWEELRANVELHSAGDVAGLERATEDDLLDELRLQGIAYERERELALARFLILRQISARRQTNLPIADDDMTAFRAARRLEDDGRLAEWLDHECLTRDAFTALVAEETRVQRYRDAPHAGLGVHMAASLRLGTRYGHLASRAKEKQRLLARWGLEVPGLANAGITESELWQWFFESLLGTGVPDDLAAYACRYDYADVDHMRRVAVRELLFRRRAARPEARAERETPSSAPQAVAHE